jgi:GAF domain-containing protein
MRIVAQKGFEPRFFEPFQPVDGEDDSAGGRALRTRQVVQIEDVTKDAAEASHRKAAAEAGYRAVQSMPLIGKDGAIVGVLSVHFRDVHAFTERDRQLGDMLGRVAADLIESRAQRERLWQLNEGLRHCSDGSLPPPRRLRRTRRSAFGAKAGRSRGSLAHARSRCYVRQFMR